MFSSLLAVAVKTHRNDLMALTTRRKLLEIKYAGKFEILSNFMNFLKKTIGLIYLCKTLHRLHQH